MAQDYHTFRVSSNIVHNVRVPPAIHRDYCAALVIIMWIVDEPDWSILQPAKEATCDQPYVG